MLYRRLESGDSFLLLLVWAELQLIRGMHALQFSVQLSFVPQLVVLHWPRFDTDAQGPRLLP